MDSGGRRRESRRKSFLGRLLRWCIPQEPSSESSSESSCLQENDRFEYVLEDRAVYRLPRRDRRRDEDLGRIYQRKRVYEYVRKKAYSRMNPYEGPPNDFLNHISSVFVENLKEPVPKDPLCKPRVYNNQPFALPFRRRMRMFSGKVGRRQSVYRSSAQDPGFSYKEAIEDDQLIPRTDEKVLIWKIVVVDSNKEDKQK